MSKTIKQGSYKLTVYDNEIDPALQSLVSDFLMDSEYCVNFYDHSHSLWYPREDKLVTPRNFPSQPRLPIAWDEESLCQRAPVIGQLWLTINKLLNDEFEIQGVPEGMPRYMTGISPVPSLDKPNGTPGTPGIGWRVYGSGNERELQQARTKSIHRDSPLLDQEQYFNLVYFANPEWHPQFYGETLFHSDHADTGDYTGKFENDQSRHFPIGDVENVVAPRPGRFMLFDARYMHQVKPSAHYAMPIMGVVFRLRLKTPG
jgi:hypothetical protein